MLYDITAKKKITRINGGGTVLHREPLSARQLSRLFYSPKLDTLLEVVESRKTASTNPTQFFVEIT